MLSPDEFDFEMPAYEAMTKYPMWPGDQSNMSEHAAWLRKQERANDKGLTESIMEHGIQEPITIVGHPITNMGQEEEGEHAVYNGHHRLAAAVMIDPDMKVPIRRMLFD